jgi:tetratricopeptide (TPR) repeat protein
LLLPEPDDSLSGDEGGIRMHRLVLGLSLIVAPVATAAQDSAVIEGADNIAIEIEAAREDDLSAGFDLIQAGKPAQAIARFDRVIAGYESERRDTVARCADSLEEATILSIVLMADSSVDGDVTILGRNWCSALFGKGFALIDLNRPDEAEAYLERATVMAPLEAHYVNELAELYKNRRQWQLSYDTFARALEVADTAGLRTSPKIKARSLRGMGFTTIELGDLETAEELFHRSLELDPGNPGAKAELEYIADLRARES